MMNRLRRSSILTALVVAALIFASAASARADGLVALYTFNGTLSDASGHGKTAHDSGTPTYLGGAPFGGKAISFAGDNRAVVTVPLNISPAAMPRLTMGAWVYADSIATPNYGVISNDDGGFDRSLDIDARPVAGKATWSAFVGGQVVGQAVVVPKKWYFIAVSFDQSSGPDKGKYVFIVNDGSTTTTLTGNDAFDANSVTTAVSIGRNPNFDQAFTGKIANAFFYNGILTPAQLAEIIVRGPVAIPGYKGNT